MLVMSRGSGKVHVVRVRKTHVDKGDIAASTFRHICAAPTARAAGSQRDGRQPSALPEQVVDWIDAGLKGEQLVPAGCEFTIAGSLPHGHVAAVAAMARTLGLPALLGPSCRARDLVLALIISRVVRRRSSWPPPPGGPMSPSGPISMSPARPPTRSTPRWTGCSSAKTRIEAKLAAKHLGPEVNPARMALFDLTSSWVTGRCCELAARGYSRDGKKGCEQIEYGILTDPAGRPVAVRVFEGNTADPVAFTEIVPAIRDTFGIENLVLVGDRGMITSARIDALRELNDDPNTATDFGWITALRAPDIAKLAADDGPCRCRCSTPRTWPRSPTPTSPASG